MTEFRVQVVQIGKVGKHPNADNLSITQVGGRYPVVFTTGSFLPGSLAVHVPCDALVPVEREEFSWLAPKATNGVYRVRATKLRGIPSFGFLVPLPVQPNGDEALSVGQDVRHLLGVTKYDPGPAFQLIGGGDMETCSLAEMIPHYDIEGLRKYESLFTPGEQVMVTEKIHGTNGRWVYVDGKLSCGSRTKFRSNSVWNRMAEVYFLKDLLSVPEHHGLVLYGEVYGEGIQDLTYETKGQRVAFFDVYDTRRGKWWDCQAIASFCLNNSLPHVPVLYRGPFDLAKCYSMAEGTSTMAPSHVREGIVVKPMFGRWDQEIGRVFLKLPGEGYLLRHLKTDNEPVTLRCPTVQETL